MVQNKKKNTIHFCAKLIEISFKASLTIIPKVVMLLFILLLLTFQFCSMFMVPSLHFAFKWCFYIS